MINEVILLGKIYKIGEFIDVQYQQYLHIIIKVEKAFPNHEGIYEYDEIDCLLWRGEGDQLIEHKQHLPRYISIKGRLGRLNTQQMYVFVEKMKYMYMDAK